MNSSVKLLIITTILLLSNCVKQIKVIDLKSPCVSGEDGPCKKRPVNLNIDRNIYL
jgi:hypothetical protein